MKRTIISIFNCNFCCSAIAFSSTKNVLYTCSTEGDNRVTKYVKCSSSKSWILDDNLPRTDNDNEEVILQLKLNKDDNVLFGMFLSFYV